jgi:hypothetical protein
MAAACAAPGAAADSTARLSAALQRILRDMSVFPLRSMDVRFGASDGVNRTPPGM